MAPACQIWGLMGAHIHAPPLRHEAQHDAHRARHAVNGPRGIPRGDLWQRTQRDDEEA
jgi:hypothetical protein